MSDYALETYVEHHLPYNLFTQEKKGHVHLMGICGVGTAGVAWLLHLNGWRVSGCDSNIPPLMGAFFRRNGITVYQNHNHSHITDCDALVYSAAIASDEPERVLAEKRGLPVLSRGQCLAGFVNSVRSVAVCGTHGKTTTSCFTTRLLQRIGEDPIWCLGGYTNSLNTTVGPLTSKSEEMLFAQRLAVVEADESDGTLAYERPAVTIVTNIDMDHLDHFADESQLEACFTEAITHTRESLAVCADHLRASRLATCFKGRVLTYGLSEDAVVRASNLRATPTSTTFELWVGPERIATVLLPVPGEHNVQNALGAFTAGILLGLPKEALAMHLGEACSELPTRRFQWLTAHNAPIRIVTDYAHHPIELKAMMSIAVLQQPKRLRMVFQPHRYSRTKSFLHDFPSAFVGADEVILMPVYEASERFTPGGETHDLYAEVRKQFPEMRVLLARSEDEVLHYLLTTAQEGDMILIAGAGDVVRLGPALCENVALMATTSSTLTTLNKTLSNILSFTPNESLAKHTFYKVGGEADAYTKVTDIAKLSALAMVCRVEKIPLTLLGQGSNIWFSDFGLHGVLCKLKGEAFEGFTREGDVVTVGAGMIGASFLNRLEAEGLAGLEFMQGVPGTLGGWVNMNAGAHGHDVWEKIEGLRIITNDGQLHHITKNDVTAGYRAVRGLQGVYTIAVTFRLEESTPDSIHQARMTYAEKRVNVAGLNTCGSLFKNPNESTKVGMILDRLGVKTLRIGGASVAPSHANILVANEGATASDLLALTLHLRTLFREEKAMTLQTEVRGFDFEFEYSTSKW